MYSLLKNFYKCKVLKVKLSKKRFVRNSIFSLLPTIFLRAILCPLFLLLLVMSCKENPTDSGEPPKPPGYQEDIPWPSLANSPWPMHHHDPQSTGRSIYSGPKIGIIEWEYIPELNLGRGITGATVIDKDNSIYFLTNSGGGLVHLSQFGNVEFNYPIGSAFENLLTPVIKSDSSIICGDGVSNIYAFNSSGEIEWMLNFPPMNIFTRNLNVDLEGNVYFVANDTLYSISKDGYLAWKLGLIHSVSVPFRYQTCFSPDGKTIYIVGSGSSVIAVDIKTEIIKWKYGTNTGLGIMVDSQGNLYAQIYNEGLIVFDESGNIKWKYIPSSTGGGDTAPSIDKYGNIYFASDSILYSLNYDGKLNWEYNLQGIVDSPIVCDLNGTIYLGVLQDGVSILAINQLGNLIWKIKDNSQNFFVGSPSIGSSGKLVVSTEPGKIISIK